MLWEARGYRKLNLTELNAERTPAAYTGTIHVVTLLCLALAYPRWSKEEKHYLHLTVYKYIYISNFPYWYSKTQMTLTFSSENNLDLFPHDKFSLNLFPWKALFLFWWLKCLLREFIYVYMHLRVSNVPTCVFIC